MFIYPQMDSARQGRNQMLNHGGISRKKAQKAQKKLLPHLDTVCKPDADATKIA
jgi:hypothetical protein